MPPSYSTKKQNTNAKFESLMRFNWDEKIQNLTRQVNQMGRGINHYSSVVQLKSKRKNTNNGDSSDNETLGKKVKFVLPEIWIRLI